MIRLTPNPTFAQGVDIALPGSDATEKAEFVFRALPFRQVLSLWMIAVRDGKTGRIRRWFEYLKLCWRVRRLASMVDLLDELIVSWSGFNVDYNKANLRLLLIEYPGSALAIFFAYFSGLREARTKN